MTENLAESLTREGGIEIQPAKGAWRGEEDGTNKKSQIHNSTLAIDNDKGIKAQVEKQKQCCTGNLACQPRQQGFEAYRSKVGE